MTNHPRTWTLIPPPGTRFINEFGSNCSLHFLEGEEDLVYNTLMEQLAEQLRFTKMQIAQRQAQQPAPKQNISRDTGKRRIAGPTQVHKLPTQQVQPAQSSMPKPTTMGAPGSVKEVPAHLAHILAPQMAQASPVDKPRGKMVTKMTQHGLQTSLEPLTPEEIEQQNAETQKPHDPTINIEVSEHLKQYIPNNPVDQGNEIVNEVNDNETKEIDPNDAAE